MLLSYLPLFAAEGQPINVASILPGLLASFGDISDVLAQVAPRKVLVAAGVGETSIELPSVEIIKNRFTADPRRLVEWMRSSK
jgi:hypothetical protein